MFKVPLKNAMELNDISLCNSLYLDIYGMKVTNCLVRDGLNWGEQPLINDDG